MLKPAGMTLRARFPYAAVCMILAAALAGPAVAQPMAGAVQVSLADIFGCLLPHRRLGPQ